VDFLSVKFERNHKTGDNANDKADGNHSQQRQPVPSELMVMRRRWMDTQELIAKWKAAA
jgi:hypothetical protein